MPDTITTVAGGVGGPGPAGSVSLTSCGLRFAGGALYAGTGDSVRRINPGTGWVTDVAGDDALGSPADGAVAVDASIGGACNLARDSQGNIVLPAGGAIDVVAGRSGRFYGRKMTAGHLYTVATGFVGGVVDVEPGVGGNLLVTEDGEQPTPTSPPGGAQVKVVAERAGTFYGQKMTAGNVYVIAGTVQQLGWPANGQLATQAWLTPDVGNLRVDSAGNLVLAAPGGTPGTGSGSLGPLVRVIAEKTGTFYGLKMRPGRIYDIAGNWMVFGHSGNGVPATKAKLYAGAALTLDSSGNVLIADWGQVRVIAVRTGTFYGRKMRAGYLYTIAGTIEPGFLQQPVYSGDGGPALKAVFATIAVTVDGAGNVVLTSNSDRVLAVAEKTGTFYGKKMRAGHIYKIAGNGARNHSGDGGPATRSELLPVGVVIGRVDGLTLIPDISGGAAVTPTVRAVASRSGTFFGQKMTAGDIYTIAGGTVVGPRSGVPATKAGFYFGPGTGLTVTAAGNLVVPQSGFYLLQVVADRAGTFYGHKMTAGDIYTIAGNGTAAYSGDGGTASKAQLTDPNSATTDAAGNILLVDEPRVRVIAARSGAFYGQQMTAGDIYTIAGDGSYKYSGDGGPATAAGLSPGQVAVDKAGNVLIGDVGNCRLRVLAARSGTFYGQHMTAGDIYTIAGNGSCQGTLAEGLPATSVPLSGSLQVAIDSAGNLVLDRTTAVEMVAVRNGTFFGRTMTAGDIYVIAGPGTIPLNFGDGGPATRAAILVGGLTLTPAGNLLLADIYNHRIRSVAA